MAAGEKEKKVSKKRCLTGSGMDGHYYLVLPYAGTLIVLVRLVWNLAQLLRKGPELREYVYKRTTERLPPQILLGIFFRCSYWRAFSIHGSGGFIQAMAPARSYIRSFRE